MTDLIPPTKGPKLSPFRGAIDTVEFEEYLGPGTTRRHCEDKPLSHVFRVRIESKQYSLQVFNFYSLEELKAWVTGENDLITDDLVRYQLDPFYAECRAFGRMVEKGNYSKVAVRCHGYAFLPPAVERQIREQFELTDWNRQREDEGQLLRAIVKNNIRSRLACGREEISVMRSRLEEMNQSLWIFNMDVREKNYRGGRLFDFSIAVTSPHIALWVKLRPTSDVFQDCRRDLGAFSKMVKNIEEQEIEKRELEKWRTTKLRAFVQARWLEALQLRSKKRSKRRSKRSSKK
ncbi:kinetochore Sim4 complex subunit FTA2-domain-containing protein [Xylaria flabelliformis]|nr:kinetochore Sim4 complex subunit FTA2-domain-containing protein [Xylaria flabelliformis]